MRAKNGKFLKGYSGNPGGRSVVNATPYRRIIEGFMPDILRSMLFAAIYQHDTQAAALLLSRVLPPLKPESLPVEGFTAETSAELAEQITAAATAGNISLEQANHALAVARQLAELTDMKHLAERLQQLEDLRK